jgi:hypothetical protein
MVRKLVELPKFLVFNSRTNSFGNSSIFTFYLLLFALYRVLYLLLSFGYGVGDIFVSAFQMEPDDYPHFDLAVDGRLCSTGQHCSGFPRVLYDTLIRLGYDGDAPVYRYRLSTAHGMDQCEVSVMIPFDPIEPWSGSIIGSELDTGIELMAHVALTSLWEDHLTATAALPITLLPIQDQENPVSRANAKGSQLDRSQRGIGVGDGWEDKNVRKLQEWLIPLAMNDLLVAPHHLHALLHDIQALIYASTHRKDASEHL